MTLLFIDGFDIYAAHNVDISAELAGNNYLESTGAISNSTIVRTVTAGQPRRSVELGAGDSFRWRAPADVPTLIEGFGLYVNSGAAAVEVLGHLEHNFGSGHSQLVTWSRDTNNALVVKSLGSTLATSSAQILNLQNWQYIEIKATGGVSTGSVVVRVDEKQVINVSAVQIRASAAGTTSFNQFQHLRGTVNNLVDDLYVCNTSGAVNNDFLGQVEVHTLMPDANGATNDWTVSGETTNFSAVDDFSPDGNTTYVRASTVGNKELYNVAELPPGITTVFGVQPQVNMKKELAGSNDIQLLVRLSTSESSSATKTLDTNYAFFSEVFETTPLGGSWTPTTVSAMQIGQIIVSTT